MEATARALQGGQVTWCWHSFGLKTQLRAVYHYGGCIELLQCLFSCLKTRSNLPEQISLYLDSFPAKACSKGSSHSEKHGSTRLSTLFMLTKEGRPWTVGGRSTVDNAANLWGLACRMPLDHTHPNIMAFLGQIMVLPADWQRLLCWCKERTCWQLWRMWTSVLPPMYKSSAILATHPSWMRSPITLSISSSRQVSDPGTATAEQI